MKQLPRQVTFTMGDCHHAGHGKSSVRRFATSHSLTDIKAAVTLFDNNSPRLGTYCEEYGDDTVPLALLRALSGTSTSNPLYCSEELEEIIAEAEDAANDNVSIHGLAEDASTFFCELSLHKALQYMPDLEWKHIKENTMDLGGYGLFE